MNVTFVKTGSRRYAVRISRDRYPDLRCGSIGYDEWLPHDLRHFVAEAEFGLDRSGQSVTLEWPRPKGTGTTRRATDAARRRRVGVSVARCASVSAVPA